MCISANSSSRYANLGEKQSKRKNKREGEGEGEGEREGEREKSIMERQRQ